MSHWAELNQNNIVVRVVVGNNNHEDEGYSWLVENLGGTWVKTSYNATFGKRRNPETNEVTNEPGFRKNFAAIGYKYDEVLDAFIPPKPFNSWILNEETCQWEPPYSNPEDGRGYFWVEEDLNWQPIESEV